MLAGALVGVVEPAEPVIAQIHLALDQFVPDRRGRILEIGHEHARAAVERVDHHLGVGRAGDLDAAVLQVGGDRADRPVALADLARVVAEVGKLAAVEALLPVEAPVEQRPPPAVEALVQLEQELERVGGEDIARTPDIRRFGGDRRFEDIAHRAAGSTQIE